MSCQVCYEVYSSDSPDIIPRRLKCSHIVCSKCILNDLTYSTYYCPECYCLLDGSGIDEISEIISITDLPPLNTGHEDGITDDESQTNSDDLLKEDSVSNPKITIRGICSYPQCTNREIDNHLCIRHCRRKLDFTEVDRIAKDIKNATFNIKTTQTNTIESVARKELNPNDLIERFSQQKRIELGEAMDLIDRARDIMIREPNILYLEAPLLAVGDIHGQFYDLLNLIQEGGPPGTEEQYLFLGDYVDRGSFSCEVMFLLLSYKVAYPEKIWLLRGNHECATVSGHFGFKQECKMKYGVNVYYRFLLLFQTMPLAAVISTAYGDIFACHGGLSPTIKTLENIENLHRFVEPEADNSLLDILWSDPIPEENIEDMTDEEYETFMNIEWRPNPSRGCSYTYGYKAIREFLDRNNLVCIVRAHEVQEDGYKKHFDPVIVEARIKRLLQTRNINSSTGSCLFAYV
jgi:diadenosine tetraphosphatase ApaH/serine/threonine PP2A family protein phosphatase